MSGNTPLFNKAGRYVQPAGKIGSWFNLPFHEWVHAYFGGEPPRANQGPPVIHLGEASVRGRCSYHVSFRVPEIPPGTYSLVLIEHTGEGAAAFRPHQFRIIA